MANFNALDRNTYDLSLKRYRDLKGVIDTSFNEGEQIGFERGEQIGQRKKEDLAIRNALQKGKLSVEEIAEMLEVTLDRVLQIKNDLNKSMNH